jgi:hypothetical protein
VTRAQRIALARYYAGRSPVAEAKERNFDAVIEQSVASRELAAWIAERTIADAMREPTITYLP